METIEIPKNSSNIEAALEIKFSNILLSHLNVKRWRLKSKVSKTEMNLNESILPNRIYVDADTNIL